MNINTRPRFSNYKKLFVLIPKQKMQNIPKQYISAQHEAPSTVAKIEPTPLNSLQYALLQKVKLFIPPFNCPTDYLTHFSMQPYKGKNAVFTLRHFIPKQSGGFAFDSNLLVFKWFVNSTEMSPFEDQSAYLAKIKAASELKNFAYFLMGFEMGFILKKEMEAPARFVQPQATKAISNEELERLMEAKFVSSGIDQGALSQIYPFPALENEETQTPTPKQDTGTPIAPKKKDVVGVKKSIKKEKGEKLVRSKKKPNQERTLVTDSESEEEEA